MATLRHIAEKAGVTIATVSLALRGAPNISAAKKEQIRQIATELGYKRNANISSLMRHIRQVRPLPKGANIALLLVHPSPHARKEFVFVDRRFKGMEERLEERGYQPSFFWYNDSDCPPERLNKILIARGIRGVVMAVFRHSELSVQLKWDRFAVSTQSNFNIGPKVHRVVEDYFANTVTALTALWESGCRRIGLAYKATHAPSAYFHITAAYARMLSIVNRSFKSIPEIYTPANLDREGFMKWLRRTKPDAILTFDWIIVDWMKAAGISIPGEISVAVLNRCPSSPDLSGVDPDPEALGAIAVDLVIEQLENNEIGLPKTPKVLMLAGQWNPGTTTRMTPQDAIGTLRLNSTAP